MMATDGLGVVGTGTMGASIAALALSQGMAATVWTRGGPAAAAARVRSVLLRHFDAEAAGGMLARLSVCHEAKGLATVVAVIEATPEDPGLKRKVFVELDGALPAETLLFSNTSVLGPEIFALVSEERLPKTAVLHFFHPVFRMELAEINAHAATDGETIRKAQALALRLGRQPLTIHGVPGGVVSRVVLAAINEAARLIDSGGLAPDDIDHALVLGAHYPLGPLRLADLVGIDIVLDNLKALSVHEGTAFQPAPAILRLVRENRLGRKTGSGFFDYTREVATSG